MFALLRNFKLLLGLLVVFILMSSILGIANPIEYLKTKVSWTANKINEGFDWFKNHKFFEFLITMKDGFVNTEVLTDTKEKIEKMVSDFIKNPDKAKVEGVKVFDAESSWEDKEIEK